MPKKEITVTVGNFGIGTMIAVVISWTVNHSIGWAILHGILGWFYVIYAIITSQISC